MAGYNMGGDFKKKKDSDFKVDFNLKNLSKLPGGPIVLLAFLVIVAVFIGRSCFYIVGPSEQAVVKQFGSVNRVSDPGPHFKLPYPAETVSAAKVQEVHRMAIGYRELNSSSFSQWSFPDNSRAAKMDKSNTQATPSEALMLTGDENIISIDFIVQYKISDVVQYLFNLQNVENTIRLASEASIREVAGKANFDDLVTIGKEQVQEETRTLIQSILNDYKAGVQVVAVELQDIAPPAQVMSSFQDVASAREDKNKLINEAEAYANQKMPMARAQVATIMLEAESYRAEVLAQAEGEASRFTQVYDSYRRTQNITRKRMYLEAMTNIIKNSEVIVVDSKFNTLNLFSGVAETPRTLVVE